MTLDEFLSKKSEIIGKSDWLSVSQDEIDTFGKVTHDIEPMHNDPEWCAKNSPFKKTIVYGFQTVSLMTKFMADVSGDLFVGSNNSNNFPLNYGFEKLRLISPVLVDDSIRAHFVLNDAIEKKPGELLITLDVTVEIQGRDKPALVAQWLVYWISDDGLDNVKRTIKKDK